MRTLIYPLVFLTVFFSAQLAAEPLTLDQLKKVQKKLQTSDYLTIDFKQEAYSSLRKRSSHFSGRGMFAKPSKFHWIQEKPVKKEFIFSGTELVQYLPDQKSASKFKANDDESSRFSKLSDLVLNMSVLLDEYKLVKAERVAKEKIINVNLEPKTKSTDIIRVDLVIAEDKNFVKTVVLSYDGGKRYTYQFSNPSFDPIAETNFRFEPPPGVKLEVFP
jgi:outer membrane lipoprotein-sorting protein